MTEQVFIYDNIRTPRGKARTTGGLHEMPPHQLLSALLEALPRRIDSFDAALVSDLLVGCVTPVGDQGYNVAQAALLAAAWPDSVAAAQVNRFCASGLESIHSAAARVAAGWDNLLVAGGVESMSRVPLGSDGGALLQDPDLMLRSASIPQGIAADLIATSHGFSRKEVDAYALLSQQRVEQAVKDERFERAIVPIMDESGLLLLDRDEHPRPSTTLEALSQLTPAFAKTGQTGFDDIALMRYPSIAAIEHVHTAGNSSGLVDGAALSLIGSAQAGKALGLRPRARLRSIAIASSDPTMMLLGLIPATERALERAGLKMSDIDLLEVNEAFAAVPLAFMAHFGLKEDRINVNGGAIALGHPVGATGSMLLGTLVDELERQDKTLGLVTLCAGGGQGIAAIVEREA